MKFRRIIWLLSVVAVTMTLTACVGEEPNEIAYVTALGIDKQETGYLYTIQFANPTKISGGASEEGGTGGNIVENISVKAPTIYSAINIANAIVSKDLSLSHAKIIVVAEEVAADGLGEIIDVIARNNDIRPDVYLAVAENSEQYLEGVKPVIELNPVKYYQLTYENNKGTSIPRNNASEFYMSCISGDKDCVLPLAGVAENESDGEDSNKKESEEQNPSKNKKNQEADKNDEKFQNSIMEYYAGEAGVAIKNKSESVGGAVFKGSKFICRLESVETEIYNLLTEKMERTRISFYTEDNETPMSVNADIKQKPKYRIDLRNKSVEIDINIDTELLSAPEEYRKYDSMRENDEKNRKMVEDAAEKFINKMYGECGADVLGVKGKLKRYFDDNKSYERYIDTFVPSEWEFTVNVNIDMRRTGMTYYY